MSAIAYEAANMALLEYLHPGTRAVLDIGCGTGEAADAIRARLPQCRIWGLTRSPVEAEIASRRLEKCFLADIEAWQPERHDLPQMDAIICSHVLEHLVDPDVVVERLSRILSPQGRLLMAVPNVAHWKSRISLLRGRFEYSHGGLMDETHLRFFTYETASRFLLRKAPDLRLVRHSGEGASPLGPARRFLPKTVTRTFDALAVRTMPNVFAWQILLDARPIGKEAV